MMAFERSQGRLVEGKNRQTTLPEKNSNSRYHSPAEAQDNVLTKLGKAASCKKAQPETGPS